MRLVSKQPRCTVCKVAKLRVRWLAKARYDDVLRLQRGLCHQGTESYLVLCEHDEVVTLGRRADPTHIKDSLSDSVPVFQVERGGDVTWHGPGQLVGYPVVSLEEAVGAALGSAEWVRRLEELMIRALAECGLSGFRREGLRGVWVGDGDSYRKIGSVGVKVEHGRTFHGFSLNVSCDLSRTEQIVSCGIEGVQMTSICNESIPVDVRHVKDVVVRHAACLLDGEVDIVYAGVDSEEDAVGVADTNDAGVWESVQLRRSNTAQWRSSGVGQRERKPEWLRKPFRSSETQSAVTQVVRSRSLITVCEEAGCPNISECWSAGTATFMLNGKSCTRNCSFCLVDTAKPEPFDGSEPARVADAVQEMGLEYVVLTAVARDDLADGGAETFAGTIRAIRAGRPGCQVEVLIPDFSGNEKAMDMVFAERPDVLNHNIETVLRLQRAVRSRASYQRSLGVLSKARSLGLVTKSGIMVGVGESDDEVLETLQDLHQVGVSIVTIGQYLRPSADHLAVKRWVEPATFERYRAFGESIGIAAVESGPYVRSSYHAAASKNRASGTSSA